jgi:drug/metabolite transporter (DMT)-like permease
VLADVPSHAIACASQVFAALALMPLLPLTTIPGPVTGLVVANVLGLAIGSTAIAYLIYFKLIADVGPQRALTVTFLIPLFGVLWGALFLREPLTASMLSGGALIVGGVWLALRR